MDYIFVNSCMREALVPLLLLSNLPEGSVVYGDHDENFDSAW
jgi:hypothetical protein